MRELTLAVLAALVALSTVARGAAPVSKPASDEPVLVVVNGQKLTEADLERRLETRQVPSELRSKVREAFLQEMVDARLIGQFLAAKKIRANKRDVEQQVRQIRDFAAQSGDPETVLQKMGYTEETLREELALPIAWKYYIDQVITRDKLKKYFLANRSRFDGTKVHARQILLKVQGDAEPDWQEAEERLARLRAAIVDGKLSFEAAARKYSEAPSKEQGGDVGSFPFAGKMPASFSERAFALKAGELSEPFRSRYGVHICQVIERVPGDLSLEDVRDEVLAQMAQEHWKKTVAELRKSAKIEWLEKEPAHAAK